MNRPGRLTMDKPLPTQRASAAEALLLTPEEAATVLRVGRTTVYALMKTGDLRPVHIGRSCRLSRAELERYVSRLDESPAPARSPA
jgi:excisionase family DNA binding protein